MSERQFAINAGLFGGFQFWAKKKPLRQFSRQCGRPRAARELALSLKTGLAKTPAPGARREFRALPLSQNCLHFRVFLALFEQMWRPRQDLAGGGSPGNCPLVWLFWTGWTNKNAIISQSCNIIGKKGPRGVFNLWIIFFSRTLSPPAQPAAPLQSGGKRRIAESPAARGLEAGASYFLKARTKSNFKMHNIYLF